MNTPEYGKKNEMIIKSKRKPKVVKKPQRVRGERAYPIGGHARLQQPQPQSTLCLFVIRSE
ncbi:unnamed protein product [Ceratitis capitata]|uniref:(Mediterranean fruit fly) hypothetical protein n=1 Tax=Ceratitis capitata TaxID=7213 RepID=A0A811UNF9_CERCA|nr:unnamed protein product [Ceratitis capitata]